jgi:NO-binding membrane sensor protein with MHYT domain
MLNISQARSFVSYVLPAVLRPLRVLWNQIIGFFFVVIAILAGFRTVPLVREFDGDPGDLFRVLLSTVFTAMMAGFGIYSFWRAHKVPK